MKDSTLKDFYSGSLNPADRQMVPGSELSRATEEVSRVEELLRQAVGAERRPLLKHLMNASGALNAITAEASYIDGFKTGARLILEVLDESHENIEPISE